MKDKVEMTQDLINQLHKNGWLSKKLKQEYLDKIDEIVEKHKDKKGPMKLMLHEVQDELGYIPFEAMEKISVIEPKSMILNILFPSL